jgi:hypothetical protein
MAWLAEAGVLAVVGILVVVAAPDLGPILGVAVAMLVTIVIVGTYRLLAARRDH